ncbi:unnamed protein product [Sphenostylis stenocarpa]|uniref:Uncharacterized protein n=1 Tax=Sphenostylis stenocarpa TaxID=92480 RepID=A0AA86SKX8_9FABA|nr:unnamed protein product [Sphenostylis stenocarpa]
MAKGKGGKSLGFRAIVNKELVSRCSDGARVVSSDGARVVSSDGARVVRGKKKKQGGDSPSALIQSISLAVFWIWKMIMLLLHGSKAQEKNSKSKRGKSRKKSR